MWVERLTARTQALLALSLLGALLLAAGGLVAGPYIALAGSYERRIDALAQKVARYQHIASTSDAVRAQQRELSRLEQANGYYLGGGKPALVATDLQRRVKQVIEQYGGTVVSSQLLGEKDEQGVPQISLRVTMRAGTESLEKVLHALEASPPVFVLDNIHIGARPGGATVRWRGADVQQELDVRLDVTGFRRPAAVL